MTDQDDSKNNNNSNTQQQVSSSSSSSSFLSSSSSPLAIHNIVDSLTHANDWNNRIQLQAKFPNLEKGWQVQVEWKDTPFGVGLFCAQDHIDKGTILRKGILGRNLMQFTSLDDIETFCRRNYNADDDATNDTELYKARLNYVKDYLWGFNKCNTDEGGYLIETKNNDNNDTTLSSKNGSDQDESIRFYGMWIPGNGLNHNETPNTVYRVSNDNDGIDLIALTDIQMGEELYDDYRRHGNAPDWLLQFAKEKQVTLNFADCNDFVNKK